MNKIFSFLIVANSITGFSQSIAQSDSTLHNFRLPQEYETSVYGTIPHYTKAGMGKQTLILIPGLGFDESVFMDFMSANMSNYQMYSITIPGFGNTAAAPVPPEGTSFGMQTWSKGVREGILNLIEKEEIKQPILIGHFTLGTQLALRMAIEHPGRIGGVIIIGGPLRFIPIQNGKVMNVTMDQRIYFTDKFGSPFYNTVTKSYWDSNNYMRELYSLDPHRGDQLWKMVADVPIQVMVRYLCEYQAEDVTADIAKIRCPVLVIRPGFKNVWFDDPMNGTLNYIKPQYVDSWEEAKKLNTLIEIEDVKDSGVFTWKDQPEITNETTRFFIRQIGNEK